MLNVVSLGAGVQSTTVVLMAAAGEIAPMPDCAIFADTGAEPDGVYRHLEWLMAPGRLPFPVHVVSAGSNIYDELMASCRGEGKRGAHARPPFFIVNPTTGKKGMVRRQCTGDYKVVPIERKVRQMLGLKPRARWPKAPSVRQWMGISLDEASRMRDSRRPAVEFFYPLIDLRMRRRDCIQWLKMHGFPTPPKSACTFCPFHDDGMWRNLKDNDQAAWQQAVTLDRALRHGLKRLTLKGTIYLHPSMQPLEDVDLSTAEDHGQANLFNNECEGHCGV